MSKIFTVSILGLLILLMASFCLEGRQYYYSGDELMYLSIVKGATLKDVLRLSLYDPHPPLGYIIRHYWLKLSDNIGFVRSLGLLFGLPLILLYYRIGKLLNGEMTGIYTAVMMAFSNGCIIQFYVTRSYPIFLCFISLAFYYLHGCRYLLME